ncbi:MAG: hypothetical protein ABI270_03415 [Nitrosospira sp.]
MIGDDATLGTILNSDLSEEEKPKLLPVVSIKPAAPLFQNRLVAPSG